MICIRDLGMANEEHIRVLKQGVEAWNKWRLHKLGIRPELSRADLSRAYLTAADLSGANLREANLSEADLCGAKLWRADLSMANLSRTGLSRANLVGAELNHANLSEAKLWQTDLRGASVYGAIFRGANLSEANLSGLLFVGVDFHEASLSKAELVRANLEYANLSGVNLQKANLKHADLRYCRLVRVNLTRAILTGARLYATARDDWIIRNVECEYVRWDAEGEQRSPKDRDLNAGEFERLYAALPFFEYAFEHGMSPLDPIIMDRVVYAIRERRPKWDIKIDSINVRGFAPTIKFTVRQEEHKASALKEVHREYEKRIRRLEAEKDRLYALLAEAIDKTGDLKLITAGPGAYVATDGSVISVEHIRNALELAKAVAKEPETSKNFHKKVKKQVLDIIGGAIEDIAKGQVKEAAKQIVELGRDLGPIITKTAAYALFHNMLS